MWNLAFLKATAERAVKTLAQGLSAFLVSDVTGLFDVDWARGFSISGLAAALSVLTSIASGGLTGGGPSLTNAEVITPDAPAPRHQPPGF